jgi:hypothetical protein
MNSLLDMELLARTLEIINETDLLKSTNKELD